MFFYSEPDSQTVQTDPYFYNTSLLLKMDSDFSDSSIHQHTVITVGNTIISSAESKYGGASGYFDGSGDRLVISPASDELEFGNENYTVEFWMNPVPTLRGALFSKGLPNSLGADYLTCEFMSNGSLLYALGSHASGNPASNIITTTTFTTGQWYHIAIVRNGDTTSLYVNGTEDGSFNSSYTISTGGDFLIGRGWYFDEFNRNYNGYIDDFRVTKGVARYTANFTPPDSHPTTGPSEIVSTDLQLHLDAGNANSYPGTGTTWYDLSGNGRNATLVNGVSYSTSPGYLNLDGNNDYISLPTDVSITELSIDMWFQLNDFTDGYLWVIDNFDNPEIRMLVNTDGRLHPIVYDDAQYVLDEYTPTYLSTNTWYNLVYTISASGVKIYLNNQLEISSTTNTYTGADRVEEHTLGTYNRVSPGFGGYRNSKYAIFRYYNKVLTSAEVLQNFNATKSRFGL